MIEPGNLLKLLGSNHLPFNWKPFPPKDINFHYSHLHTSYPYFKSLVLVIFSGKDNLEINLENDNVL